MPGYTELHECVEALRSACEDPNTVRKIAADLPWVHSSSPLGTVIYLPGYADSDGPLIPEVADGGDVTLSEMRDLLLRYADDPDRVYFLADMMED
jgi:hypothetical protein